MKDHMTINELLDASFGDGGPAPSPLFEQEEWSGDIVDALCEQHNFELFSWYVYYTAGAWLEAAGFPGMSSWMVRQAQEELTHAKKIFEYVLDKNAKLAMTDIQAPDASWVKPLDVFEAAYEHEKKNTGRFQQFHKAALAADDHQTASFLNWFLDEQVEEEKKLVDIIDALKRVEGDGTGLNALDHEMGEDEAPGQTESD